MKSIVLLSALTYGFNVERKIERMTERLNKCRTRCNTAYAPTDQDKGREKTLYTWNKDTSACEEILARKSNNKYPVNGNVKANLFNTNEQCVSSCTTKIEFFENAIADLQADVEIQLKSVYSDSESENDVPVDPFCEAPIEAGFSGSGAESTQRWHYDSEVGKCESFIFNGYGGNENNYKSKVDCQNQCIPVCFQPKEVGPCRAWFHTYWYNAETKECEHFGYGGCFGNGNRFATKSQCESYCADFMT